MITSTAVPDLNSDMATPLKQRSFLNGAVRTLLAGTAHQKISNCSTPHIPILPYTPHVTCIARLYVNDTDDTNNVTEFIISLVKIELRADHGLSVNESRD